MKNIEIDFNDLILSALGLSDDLQNYLYWMSPQKTIKCKTE